MGPGTGLGLGYLTKPRDCRHYEVHASEGGHSDFSVVNQEDWDLHQFTLDYIKNSKNVENMHGGNKEIQRVSIERLCAGPAVPLLYEFYKTREHYKDLPRPLEEKIHKDDLTAENIISRGMQYEENQDELCYKVVQKFAEILAVEVGNAAIYYLPFGGIYLVGGVTMGIMNFLDQGKSQDEFLRAVYNKGRLEPAVRRVPLFIVRPEVELGILGTEECAYRQLEDEVPK